MVWSLLPLLLASQDYSLEQIGIVAATYPAVWALVNYLLGKWQEVYCKKNILFWGMLIQAVALVCFIFFPSYQATIGSAALLTLLSACIIQIRMYCEQKNLIIGKPSYEP